MAEIAEKLQTTHATVLYWLKKYQIPRRTWRESAYVKQNPSGDPFRIPKTLTARQQELMAAGLLLYWAEGSKTDSATRIANLDQRMLELFARFLRDVCHVDEQRLSLYVRVHKRFVLESARRYWSRHLHLPLSRVLVYPHSDSRSKAYQQWSSYGLATLEFHNTKFKQWLDTAIEHYVNKRLEVHGPHRHH